MPSENGAQGADFVIDGLRAGAVALPRLLVGADVTVRDVGEQEPTEDRVEVPEVGGLDRLGLWRPGGLLVREIVLGGLSEQRGQRARLDVVYVGFDLAMALPLDFGSERLAGRARGLTVAATRYLEFKPPDASATIEHRLRVSTVVLYHTADTGGYGGYCSFVEQALDFGHRHPHGAAKTHARNLPLRNPCPNRVHGQIQVLRRLFDRPKLLTHSDSFIQSRCGVQKFDLRRIAGAS
jgi:hypothetical protein